MTALLNSPFPWLTVLGVAAMWLFRREDRNAQAVDAEPVPVFNMVPVDELAARRACRPSGNVVRLDDHRRASGGPETAA